MFDIITVGSATEDVFVNLDETKIVGFEDRHHKDEYLALPYGAKINVDSIVLDTGGGAVNTAATCAAMGLQTAALCKIGRDLIGQRIIKSVQESGADTSLFIECDDYASGYSVIITGFTGDRTILVYRGAATQLCAEDIPWEQLAEAAWIYIGSMHGPSASLFRELAVFAGQHDIQVAINPGGTQLAGGMDKLADVFAHTTAIFLNRSEAYKLTGVAPERGPTDERQMLRLLNEAGCRNVIITVGAEGSWGYDGRSFYTMPAYPTEVVSTVGAGDAFAAGCIVGLYKGLSLNAAMRIGAANAASVVSRFGAKEGILTWPQAQEFVAAHGGASKHSGSTAHPVNMGESDIT